MILAMCGPCLRIDEPLVAAEAELGKAMRLPKRLSVTAVDVFPTAGAWVATAANGRGAATPRGLQTGSTGHLLVRCEQSDQVFGNGATFFAADRNGAEEAIC